MSGDPPPPERWVGRATAHPTPAMTQPQVILVPAPAPRRSAGKVALMVFGVLAAVCALGATSLLVLAALVKASPNASLGVAPPGLHSPVRDGRFEFVVTGFSCGHATVGRSFVTRSAQGQFCLATLSITNVGTGARTFAEGFQKAFGPDGTEYGTDPAAGVIENSGGTTVWTTVNPGNSLTGTIVFDIPKAASIVKLELHDSPLSGGVTVTLT